MPIQFSATIELSDLDGKSGVKINGVGVNNYSGTSVSAPNEVNDGLIIGAPSSSNDGTNNGLSYVNLEGRILFVLGI